MKNKTMKNTTLLLILAVVFALSAPQGAQAQTATTQTILASAVTSASATAITVASASGITASSQTVTTACWFDGELVKVNSVNSTTGALGVSRGYQTTRATTHATAQIVFCGPMGVSANGVGTPFANQNPVPGSNCTSTQYQYLPTINYQDGSIYNCLTSARGGVWIAYNYKLWAYGHPLVSVPDTAYTVTLADEYVVFSNLTAARTATLPAITGMFGKTIVVKNNTAVGTVTVAAPSGQFVGTLGTASITLSAGQTKKLISVQSSSGAWGWATVD